MTNARLTSAGADAHRTPTARTALPHFSSFVIFPHPPHRRPNVFLDSPCVPSPACSSPTRKFRAPLGVGRLLVVFAERRKPRTSSGSLKSDYRKQPQKLRKL